MADQYAKAGIVVDVKGQKDVLALADDLDNMAKVLGGNLAKAAKAGAAQLRELAEQDAAINQFNALKAQASEAAAALKSAERELANYSAQIGKGALTTREETDALVRLQGAVRDAKAAHQQSSAAVTESARALHAMGVSTKDTGSAQERLRNQIEQTRSAVAQLAPQYKKTEESATQAGAGMVRTHRQIGDGVDSISRQLTALQSAVIAVAGLRQFGAMGMDVLKTADAVNNLRARMELVTGAGKDFGAAWQGVQEVALRTHSALEDTGALFTRIAQVGKDAGLTTQKATEQSLRLTEAINQAAQLSGASAEASSAAITQLIQALQSGVLRGEEFNSIMEQAPRLSKALADGLGVTTGELRKMAEAGALSSDVVIGALKGQSEVLQKEFDKLPLTVGRALQDVGTQWKLYVGEVDKSSGASQAAATAIKFLGDHVSTLGNLLMDAGQALVAFMALGAAQHFYGLATASTRAATEMRTLGAVTEATSKQVEAAGAAAKRFDAIIGGLKTFALLTIITNFKDIGTWIGEAAAKLMGYKDRTEELARAEALRAQIAKEEAADRERALALNKAAIDRTFDLSKAAATAVGEFARLTKEGESAAQALKKVAGAFDVTQAQGLKDLQTLLGKLAADGKLTAGQVQQAWNDALNGVDLGQFEMTARQVFTNTQSAAEKAARAVQAAMEKGTSGEELKKLQDKAQQAAAEVGRASERMAQALDQGAREAVRRTGLDWAVLQGRIGEASRSAISDVDAMAAGLQKLKADGIDTGRALTASLSKAIASADSQAAIDSITLKVKELRGELGETVANGLLEQARKKALELKDAMDAATPGINSVREALKELGVKPQADLDALASKAKEAFSVVRASGTATPREINEAWRAMAQAAIDANNGVADAALASEAAAHGFAIETDKAGKSAIKSLAEVQDAARGVGQAAQEAGEQAKEGIGKIDYAAQMAGKSLEELEKITRRNWDAQRDLADQAAESNAAANEAVNAWLKQQTQQSKYYGELFKSNTQATGATKDLASALGAAQSAASRLSNTRGAPTMEHVRATQLQAQAMEALDAAQQGAARSSGEAQSGLAQLEDRLLALNAGEEAVAQQRARRDQEAVRAKMALLQLDLERARIRQNQSEIQAIEKEMAAYARQIDLIGQIAAREAQLREEKKKKDEQEQRERAQQEARDKAQREKEQQEAKAQREMERQQEAAQRKKAQQEAAAEAEARRQQAQQEAAAEAEARRQRAQQEAAEEAEARRQRAQQEAAEKAEAADQARREKAKQQAEAKAREQRQQESAASSSAPQRAPAATAAPVQYVSHISIAGIGSAQNVGFTNQESQLRVEDLLRQLAQAKRAAS